NASISDSLTEPSARIMRKRSSSSADSTGSSATLRTPGSPSNSDSSRLISRCGIRFLVQISPKPNQKRGLCKLLVVLSVKCVSPYRGVTGHRKRHGVDHASAGTIRTGPAFLAAADAAPRAVWPRLPPRGLQREWLATDRGSRDGGAGRAAGDQLRR